MPAIFLCCTCIFSFLSCLIPEAKSSEASQIPMQGKRFSRSFALSLSTMPVIFICCICIFSFLSCLIPEAKSSEEECRQLEFTAALFFQGKRLINHKIYSADVMDKRFCNALCFMKPNCVSYNLMTKTSVTGKHTCELNNATHEGHEGDLKENPDSIYQEAKNPCVNHPCNGKATCQTGYTRKGYHCLCFAGFTGQHCETDIDECAAGTHSCDANAECSNNEGSHNCTCKPGYHGNGLKCEDIDECAAGTHSCDANAECNNTKGSYNCTCKPGYHGLKCEDIDECAAGTHSCYANAECNNTKGSYNCTCKPGYHGNGLKCEDIDECAAGTHSCDVNAECNNTKGSYNCICKLGYYGDGLKCENLTCKELYDRNLARENKGYHQKVGSEKFLAYCVMSDTGMGPCGGGGWTLVMKMNGTKKTFHYDSNLWTNSESFNLKGGETGFDTEETKLPTYWSTPFTKVCLGMKIPGEEITNFIVMNQTADSLYSLIADGQFRNTSLGRNKWKALLGSQGSLQLNCNREGFSAICDKQRYSRARIGILGNNENDCITCDSRIGFGTGGKPDDTNTCGIYSHAGTDNGKRHIKTMGYVLIK